jgi:ATP-dependent RNA helicase RhlE
LVAAECVDEKKLLQDIERLLKQEIKVIAIPGYEPDKSIKAVPIKNGGGQRQSRGRSGGRSNGRSNGKPGSNTQARNGNSRSRGRHSRQAA